MIRPPRRLFWLVGPAILALSGPAPAPAQDGFDEEEAEAAATVAGRMGVVAHFGIDDSNFDMWIFNGRATGNGRDWFDARLALRLDELERSCGLTEAQKAKLRLAGRGDAKRFYDLYAEKRKKFDVLKRNQNKVNEVLQEVRPLQEMLTQGAYGRGSLFDKTLRSTLTPEQVAHLDEAAHARREFRYHARVELVVEMIDGNVGLTADQRRRLLEVLKAETKLPPRSGQYDYYLVMYQAALLPEEKLRPIFDAPQWKVVGQTLAQAKGYQTFLRTNGLLDADAKPADKPAAIRRLH